MKLLRKIKRIIDKIIDIDELSWRYRHLYNKNYPEDYSSSVLSSHRTLLIEKILSYNPKSVLELGFGSGANLSLLEGIKLYGIDINKKAIVKGKGLKATLIRGNEKALKRFSNKSIDVVFTDATLLYFNPKRLERTLKEMKRVGKQVILCEQHNNKSFYDDKWVHNYKGKKTKITNWSGDWNKYGAIIEC